MKYTVEVNSEGTKTWYLNGKLHREDGPAIESVNGDKSWWINGWLHREDGPACEWKDGSKTWYKDGLRHREDGPACEYPNGIKEWWLNGIEYTEQEFLAKMHKPFIDSEGTKGWYNEKGQFHREDGPAVEDNFGYKAWYKNGKRHREDGPAVEWSNGKLHGTKQWWLNGIEYTQLEFNVIMNPTVEMTMAEINAHFGRTVKIVESH